MRINTFLISLKIYLKTNYLKNKTRGKKCSAVIGYLFICQKHDKNN